MGDRGEEDEHRMKKGVFKGSDRSPQGSAEVGRRGSRRRDFRKDFKPQMNKNGREEEEGLDMRNW